MPLSRNDYETVVGEPYYEGDLLKGRKVNLGADDGVGVGVALAIAAKRPAWYIYQEHPTRGHRAER